MDEYPRDALLARADELCNDQAFRDAVWRHCAYRASHADIARLNTRIHRNDQMLLHSLNYFHEVNYSLSQYFNIALQQNNAARQILHHVFGKHSQNLRILDFACGYGRLLRFLTLSVPPAQIWASDIQTDAVEFVVDQFGVNGVVSHSDPQQFDPGRKFDVIWVASLFSHLPQRLFDGWLARLVSLLAKDGILCFSTRDECLLPQDMAMPRSGIHFIPTSENVDLDTAVYGTTWVNERYVRRSLREITGDAHQCFRIRRALANEQDIFVVARKGAHDLDRLDEFRQGAWGWVDLCRVSKSGDLYLRGWAASLDDGAIGFVTVTLDGESHHCPTGLESDDVRRVLNDDRLGLCDWEFSHRLGPRSSTFLEVSASSARGEAALLYAGRITASA